MNPIEEILSRLQKYPHVKYESSPTHVTVYPARPDGFEVSLNAGKGGGPPYVVSFDAWHEPFDTAQEAFKSFSFGLSEVCRLKVTSFGRRDYA